MRGYAPLATFAPVFGIGFVWASVLFLTPKTSSEPQEQPVTQLVLEGNEETLQRVLVKNSVVEDLLHGVLTWDEALDRYSETILTNETAMSNLGAFEAEGELRERIAHQLLTFVNIRVREQPRKYTAAYAIILEHAHADIGTFQPPH
jgi:hypothetical protein